MDFVDIEDIGAFLEVDDQDLDTRIKQFQTVEIKKKKQQKNENGQTKVHLNADEIKDEFKKYIESLEKFDVPGTQNIYFRTQGCAHNISDSEFMMGLLTEYGYKLVEKLEECDLVFINSCTVKNPSEQAFISLVEIAKKMKKHIVVAGCVPQGDKNIPEIQGISVVGTTQIDRCVEVVSETLKGNTVQLLGKKSLPSLDLPKIRKNHLIEIVPINTGCLGACTYCKTVHARGKLGSYPIPVIVNRVKQVAKEGVKDIWLSSEDTGAYGRDINTNIAVLLKEIVQNLPENIMIRVGMTNPPYIKAHMESIATILKHPQVYSFLHIPVQAGNNQVLEKMNREYLKEDFEELCDYLLANVPNITIATDIICGFPGETDEQFEETLQLVDKYKLAIVNISQFYPRPGTTAAKMQKVNSKDVKERSRKITKLIESYTECYSHYVGTEQCHTKAYVKVLLPFEEELMGQCIKVKITKTHRWHIEGEIIDRNPIQEKASADYFNNYKDEGYTKREEKYQEIIKQRLNEAENNKVKYSDILENFKNKQSSQQQQGEEEQNQINEQQQNGIQKENEMTNGFQKNIEEKSKQCNGDCEQNGGCKNQEEDEESEEYDQHACCGECGKCSKNDDDEPEPQVLQKSLSSDKKQNLKDILLPSLNQTLNVNTNLNVVEQKQQQNIEPVKIEKQITEIQEVKEIKDPVVQDAQLNVKKDSYKDKLSSEHKMIMLGIVLIVFGILIQCMIGQFKQ